MSELERIIVVHNARGDALGELRDFALAYYDAASTLHAAVRSNQDSSPADWYPVLFLYRHSVELAIKALVGSLKQLLPLYAEESPDLPAFFRSHNLPALWTKVRPFATKTVAHQFHKQLDELEAIAQYIDTLHGADPGSFTFRYPVDKVGDALMPPHASVDAAAVAQAAEVAVALILQLQLDSREEAEQALEYAAIIDEGDAPA